MSGNEKLNVILGKDIIAQITLKNDRLNWEYDESWQQSGFAVSPHLPLNAEIPSVNVLRFLRNLLPEGHALDELTHCFHLSKNNTLGLVRALGLDMPGSLIILPTSQKLPKKGIFREIAEEELKQRLDTQEEVSLIIWDGKPRLSVAGVQNKINIVQNKEMQLGFGEGSLCSTHILKFEKKRLPYLALNEYISMQLAKACGLDVADVQLQYFGKYATLLVKRFDRKLMSSYQVKRRHMIDGCQALNLLPEYKYERNFGSGRDVAHIRDGASYLKLFDFSNNCTNPALTKQKILDWALFNSLIFNFDAHGKNISFFVSSKGITLAPFYDIVNIKIYDHFEHEMAMGFGDSFAADEIHAYHLADFAESNHLARGIVRKRLISIITKLKFALDNNIIMDANNKEELKFIKKYQKMVRDRCDDLLKQSKHIPSITL